MFIFLIRIFFSHIRGYSEKLAKLVREEYTWKPETVNEISDGN